MKKIYTLFLLISLTSASAQFFEIHVLNIVTNDLVYDKVTDRIYTTIPAANGANGNSIGIINPGTYTLEKTVFIGSDPGPLAISGNGQYLYAGMEGSNTIRRFLIAGQTADTQFSLGSDWFGPLYAEDIEVMPGHPDVLLVSLKRISSSPRHAGVVVYDNGAIRSQTTQAHTGSNRIEFSDDPHWAYGFNNESTEFGFRRLWVDSNGVDEIAVFQNIFSGWSSDFIFHKNIVYSSDGKAVDVNNAPFVSGQFFKYQMGHPAVDSVSNQVCYALYDWAGKVAFKRFNPQTFLLQDSLALPQTTGSVKNLITCGEGCYALNTSDNKVIIIRQSPAGVAGEGRNESMRIYPNPAGDDIYVEGTGEITAATVYDFQGKKVNTVLHDNRIDISSLPAGVYIIQLKDQDGNQRSIKFLKQ